MKKLHFYVYDSRIPGLREVEGYVDLEYPLAGIFHIKNRRSWMIIDIETGLSFGEYPKTKAECCQVLEKKYQSVQNIKHNPQVGHSMHLRTIMVKNKILEDNNVELNDYLNTHIKEA